MLVNIHFLVLAIPSGMGKNNSISCFLANRKWNYSLLYVHQDYINVLVNFRFHVLAIFHQEQAKIISFPVLLKTGNGIINFHKSPGTMKICLSFLIFLYYLYYFWIRHKKFHFLFPSKWGMELFISKCPIELSKYACQLLFSCPSYFPSKIGKNNSISCLLENRKCKYSL